MISSKSGAQGNCIDVKVRKDAEATRVILTETEQGYWNVSARMIVTTMSSFKAFIDGAKAGEFDHLIEGVE